MVESGKHLDALAHLPPRDCQVFHIDPYDHPMVYVIVLLRDCEEPRFQLMYGLTSVCRSDFSESYMDLDRPPLEADGNSLRRLVLDREAAP